MFILAPMATVVESRPHGNGRGRRRWMEMEMDVSDVIGPPR